MTQMIITRRLNKNKKNIKIRKKIKKDLIYIENFIRTIKIYLSILS